MLGLSRNQTARLAGGFWLIVFIAGSAALAVGPGPLFTALNIIAPLCYAVVTVLLYDLFNPVSQPVSATAAFFGLAGCAVSLFRLTRIILVRDLVFFGFHCLLIGYLILRSTLVPRILGALMMFAGVGWLTFAWPPLARQLAPYNFLPGMLGEGLLIVWLLAKGVRDEQGIRS